MVDDRLCRLTMIAIEHEFIEQVNEIDIIKDFADS